MPSVNFKCSECGIVFEVVTSTKWYIATCPECGREYKIRPSKRDCGGCKEKERNK